MIRIAKQTDSYAIPDDIPLQIIPKLLLEFEKTFTLKKEVMQLQLYIYDSIQLTGYRNPFNHSPDEL